MNNKKLARVLHYDLYGKREEKYHFLRNISLNKTNWQRVIFDETNFFFYDKDLTKRDDYLKHFKITELFNQFSAGIQSKRDALFYDNDSIILKNRIEKLLSIDFDESFKNQYNIVDSSSYRLTSYVKNVNYRSSNIVSAHFRPFDDRYLYYDQNLIGRSFYKIMQHLLIEDNFCLVLSKQCMGDFKYVFIGKKITDMNLISNAGAFGAGFSFPLYLYKPENQIINNSNIKEPNLNNEIVQQLVGLLGLEFTPEKESTPNTFAPIDILDYIYAILHSPTYRAKYKEFLKIDFPRIPYPKDQETFWKLVKLGGELRKIHLLEGTIVERFITSYTVSGTNEVGKVRNEDGKVWINESQYFDHVPQVAWEFYIGGYQPAQKWLKDRKGRQLSFEDVRHYQKIIVALTETDRIMGEIDKLGFE